MVKRYKALKDMSLRKRPDRRCEEWFEWKEGEVFTPPEHFNVKKAKERGLIKEVRGE